MVTRTLLEKMTARPFGLVKVGVGWQAKQNEHDGD
jgi:hypothetical protein